MTIIQKSKQFSRILDLSSNEWNSKEPKLSMITPLRYSKINSNQTVLSFRDERHHFIALMVMVVLMGSRKWEAAHSEENRGLLTFGIQKISRALNIRDYRLLLPFSILPTKESWVGVRMEMNVFTKELKTTTVSSNSFETRCNFWLGAPKYRSTITIHYVLTNNH
jgi:hypothetical protein